MIFDENWVSYSMYVVGTCESGCNYGAIERYAMAGIGIVQWTYGRSWEVLNLIATDYPETESQFPILWDSIKPGSAQWGQKIFTQSEANEVGAVLVTAPGVASQNKLDIRDCENSYIPLLRDNCGFTNPKTAIFALTVYHQSPQAFYQIYSACGNCDVNTWYNTTLNNGIVGKYLNRQNTVKQLLDEWDGESGKSDFGVYNPYYQVGGNTDPGNGNPDNTVSETVSDLGIVSIQRLGKNLVLNLNTKDGNFKILFYKTGNGLYYPIRRSETIRGETEDTPVPDNPSQPGTSEDADWIVNKIQELEGTLQYSQAQSLRTNIPGGYCDCSGLVWWLYNQRGFSIGTWTGAQKNDGTLISEGRYSAPDESVMKLADLCLFDWSGSTDIGISGHIELYIGNNTIMGHGGDPYWGPTRKTMNTYFQNAPYWQIRRVIND